MDLFDFYWILLVISGILMLGIGFSGFGGRSKGVRALNIIFGAGFIGYGVYLGLFFTGGTYIIIFKAFLVPILLIVNAVRNRNAQRNTSAPTAWPAPPTFGPPSDGQPTTPWQAPNQPATPWQAPGHEPQTTWQPAPPTAQTPAPQPAAPLTAPSLTSDDVLGR